MNISRNNVTWLIQDNKTFSSEVKQTGMNLLELYRQYQYALPAAIEAVCGGHGSCGKCRVQIVQGNVPVTEKERSIFSREELDLGYRLACQVAVNEDLTVRMVQNQDFQMIQTPELENMNHGKQSKSGMNSGETCCMESMSCYSMKYCIAVDIGSTTLAAALIGPDGTVRKQVSSVNSQRAYGADVISRIQASNEGKKEALRTCICMDLQQLFQTLLTSCETGQVLRIAVAGNTTMLHLLRGYSCQKLGQAPFEPVNLELECLAYKELFAGNDVYRDLCCANSSVYLLPGLSAFVGADIAAGLYSSGFWQTPEHELALFLDLGTNGELAIGNRSGFLTTATAAGPVFEGGSLSCGVPGIPGAISGVSYLYHRVRIQTIGQKKPCGICGTGALEAVAALLQEGLLDTNGLLVPELFETGLVLDEQEDGSKIRLTQADIRNIQMAKAAIRAGIETLFLRYQEKKRCHMPKQMPCQDQIQHKDIAQLHVDRIYLAGGFGYYLSAETAVAIGLFPPEWKNRIAACGNTSLKGAAAFLTEPSCAEELERLRRKNCEIQLAEDSYFQELYMQRMQFPAAVHDGFYTRG